MKHPNPFAEITLLPGAGLGDCAPAAARLPNILGAPKDFPAKIRGLKIASIGTGAVGGAGMIELARMQPAEIWLIDPKEFKRESVLTQPITPDAIGQAKAWYIGQICKAISPGTRVFWYKGGIEDIDPVCFREIDAFLLASDNLAAEVEAGQVATYLSKPLIHSSLHGDTLVIQIRTFANRDGEGPCPACGFGQTEWLHLGQNVRFACDPGSSPEDARRTVHAEPTFSLAPLCSMAGSLLIIHLMRLTIGFGKPAGNTLFEYCAHTGKTFTTPLARNPECPCDHTAWEFRTTSESLAFTSLERLTELSGHPVSEDDPPLFQISGFDWVGNIRCPSGHAQPSGHFVRRGEIPDLGSCQTCGQPLTLDPLSRRKSVSAGSLGSRLQMPLRQLGIEAGARISIRTLERTIQFELEPQTENVK